jgi:4-hydroxy-tetrahydrodipicolinate reductase
MGQTVTAALCREADMQLVGAVDTHLVGTELMLPDGSGGIPAGCGLASLLDLTSPDVVVDFSVASAVLPMAEAVTGRRIHLVSGTTGLSAETLQAIDRMARQGGVGAVVASNFAIGAVVMMHLAARAARYFDHAEIIEEHHDQKLDAPSGTALTTARMMAVGHPQPFKLPACDSIRHDSRGQQWSGIPIHSIRLPGIVARQEVIFGAAGQTFSLKHDAISRECYIPGVILAVRQVSSCLGLVSGLDSLLGFQEE